MQDEIIVGEPLTAEEQELVDWAEAVGLGAVGSFADLRQARAAWATMPLGQKYLIMVLGLGLARIEARLNGMRPAEAAGRPSVVPSGLA